MSTRFGFGVLLLALGVVIAVIGLLDLSQEIADAVDKTSGLMLFLFGSGAASLLRPVPGLSVGRSPRRHSSRVRRQTLLASPLSD